jgi:hypothetical protein
MITFVRTADINDAKAPMAVEWALKVAAYINEKYGTNVSIQQNVGGKVNQLHWVDMYESMDESLGLGAKLNMDEGFQQLMAEAGEQGLFAANSVVDNYYQSIP